MGPLPLTWWKDDTFTHLTPSLSTSFNGFPYSFDVKGST